MTKKIKFKIKENIQKKIAQLLVQKSKILKGIISTPKKRLLIKMKIQKIMKTKK